MTFKRLISLKFYLRLGPDIAMISPTNDGRCGALWLFHFPFRSNGFACMCRARFSDRPSERRFPVRVLDGVGEGRGRPLAEILRSLPRKTVAVGALRVRWPGRDEGKIEAENAFCRQTEPRYRTKWTRFNAPRRDNCQL